MHKLQKTDIIDVVQDHGRLHGADGLLHAGQGVGRQRGGLQGRSLQVQNPQSGLKTNFFAHPPDISRLDCGFSTQY